MVKNIYYNPNAINEAMIYEEMLYWNRIGNQYGVMRGIPSYAIKSRKSRELENIELAKAIYARAQKARAAGYPYLTMSDVLYYEKVTDPVYIAEQERLEQARQLAIRIENERLALIAKNDKVALDLFDVLNAKRMKIQQDDIIRINQVIETQRLAQINTEKLRLELIKSQETQAAQKELEIQELAATKESNRINKTIPLIASVLPVSIIGLLLLYSGKARK